MTMECSYAIACMLLFLANVVTVFYARWLERAMRGHSDRMFETVKHMTTVLLEDAARRVRDDPPDPSPPS